VCSGFGKAYDLVKVHYGGFGFRLQALFATVPPTIEMMLDSKVVKNDFKMTQK